MGDFAYQSPGAPAAFGGFAAPFARIGAALGPRPQGGGTTNQVGHDPRAADTGSRDSNVAKMKALGLSAMPAGGQEELDQLYSKRQ